METVLCAAVGTASHQHGLAACTVYGTVLCAAVGTASHQRRLATCTVCGTSRVVLKNRRAVPNVYAKLDGKLVKRFRFTHLYLRQVKVQAV